MYITMVKSQVQSLDILHTMTLVTLVIWVRLGKETGFILPVSSFLIANMEKIIRSILPCRNMASDINQALVLQDICVYQIMICGKLVLNVSFFLLKSKKIVLFLLSPRVMVGQDGGASAAPARHWTLYQAII